MNIYQLNFLQGLFFPHNSLIVFLMGMKVVAAAICILPLAGCALGIGMVFCGMLYGVSRNPMSYDTVFGLSLLGLAMIELFGFICIFGAAAIAMS